MKPEIFIPSYIESLTTLLVFGITLPTIFINIPSRQRAIGNRHLPWSRLGNHYNYFGAFVGGFTVLSIIILAGFLVTPPNNFCNSQGYGFWCSIRNSLYTNVTSIAFLVLVMNIFIVVFYAITLLSYTKTQLLLNLSKKCRNQAKRRNGVIEKPILESLSELGAFCDAGRDKESILHTLKDLANCSLAFDTRAALARAIRETVIGGNSRNYIDAMIALQETFREGIKQQLGEKNEPSQYDLFLGEILLELRNVMMTAFSLNDQQVTASIMTGYDEIAMQAPTDYADGFMQIGKTALTQYEMQQALAILDKFDTKIKELFDNNINPETEAVFVYFGLLAHFWHTGNTAQRHAMKYINDLLRYHDWDGKHLDKQFTGAHEHFLTCDLETADYLEQMMYEIKQRRLVRAHLKKIGIIDQAIVMRILTNFPSIKHLKKADRDSLNACGLDEDNAQKLIRSLQ